MAFVLGNLALSLVVVLGSTAQADYWDSAGYMGWGRALLGGHGVDPTPVLSNRLFFPRRFINGRERAIDKFPIGWSLATLPFAAAGQGYCYVADRVFGRAYPLDGTGTPVVRMACAGVAAWASVGLLAVYAVARRLTDPAAAAVGLLLAWAGTAAVAYSWRSPGLSHALSFTFVSLCYAAALAVVDSATDRRRLGWTLGWGAAAGMVFCLRHLNVILLLPTVPLLLPPRPWRSVAAMVGSGAAATAGAAPFLFLQSLVWRLDYGQWYFNGYAFLGEHFTHQWANVARVLFSSMHGLFFCHLIAAAALLGLVRLGRRPGAGRIVALGAVAAVAVMVVLYGLWWDWDLGPSYGARWSTDLLLLWTIGVAEMTRDASGTFRPGRAVVLAAVATPGLLLVAATLGGRLPTWSRLHVYLPRSGWVELP